MTPLTPAVDQLRSVAACPEAIRWAEEHPTKTLRQLWRVCKRGDWMLWYWGRVAGGEAMSDERKPLVLAACECARLALHLVPEGEERPRQAIELAERWARGEAEVSHADMRAAAAAARAADAAAWAAAAAARAAAAAAWAADAAARAAADARTKTLAECAAIVRRHMPELPGGDR